ncbi:unnamed protein product [Onchocerca ochengi]|uniref:DNA helicase n=1 Tax=Onchocerca ochengi TaxID=42157 RepID=A0A182E6Z9_ONCOC|nr:unnamed protein product [Onchocerca ochengi]
MAEDILRRIRNENSNMNMDFTAKIYNVALTMIEDLRLKIANKVLSQLRIPSQNRSVANIAVISRPTSADGINACLKYSTLWRHVKTLKLTANMPVQLQNDRSVENTLTSIAGYWERKGTIPFPVVDPTS